jgi:type II secretory pathway pseudopilin PulG
VLLIMAILMAIAIPTFLGVRAGAQDRSAQSDLVNSATSLKSLFTLDGTFQTANSEVSELQSSEPEMNFTVNPVNSGSPSHQIEVIVSPDHQVVLLIAESQTGRCWDLEENEEAQGGVGVPPNWTMQQGFSYGGTLLSAGPQATCSALFPDLLPGTFTNWSRGGFPS